MSPAPFIAQICGPAQQCMGATHIPASFIIAQAALESAWGESRLTVVANNLFGIKADPAWTGERFQIVTKEYVDGNPVLVGAWFRKYPDWQASIDDHARFIQDARYAQAFHTGNGIEFGYAVAAAGYATDPQYGQKLESVITTHQLLTYDWTAGNPST